MAQEITTLRAGGPGASSNTTTRPTTRALLACGVAAAALWVVVAEVQVLTRGGFDLSRHPISLLSLGELGWIQVTNFLVAGALTIACAVGLRRVLHPGRAGTWGPLLVGAYGVGLFAAGIFVADPTDGFPSGTPLGTPHVYSWHAILHGIFASGAFLSLTVACFVFARRFAARRQPGWATYCVATGLAVIPLVWPSQSGISVRLAVAAVLMWGWVAVTAALLLREPTAVTDPRVPAPDGR